MSLRDCITEAFTKKVINESQKEQISELYEEYLKTNRKKYSKPKAEANARQKTINALKKQKALKKQQALLAAEAVKRLQANAVAYPGDDIAGVMNAVEKDVKSMTSGASERIKAVSGMAHRLLDETLFSFRRTLGGNVRNKAQLNNVVRELHGEVSGDLAASRMAKALSETFEMLRKRFNQAGGNIGKLEGWAMPQSHDYLKIRQATEEDWVVETKDLLAWETMIDKATGETFTEDGIDKALKQVYETIASNGTNKIDPSMGSRGRKLADSRSDHRFLIFKDAESWMSYQGKYGSDEYFDTFIKHIDTMARDIGLMETFGPNPSATIEYLKQWAVKRTGGDAKSLNLISTQSARIQDTYDVLTGATNAPVNERLGNSLASLRGILMAAQLGSASVAAIPSDLNFSRLAASFSNMPQTGIIKRYLQLMNPLGGDEQRKVAIRLGLIADGWTTVASGAARYIGEISGNEISRKIVDGVMKATLLTPHTQASKWAFGMEFLAYLGDNVKKSFNDLDPKLKNKLAEYNINANQWDVIRSTDLTDFKGVNFVDSIKIEQRSDLDARDATEIATRVLEMVQTETNFAVPTANARAQSFLRGSTKRGTIQGEAFLSFAMYKSFGVTILNTHMARGMAQKGTATKTKYISDFIITTTLMGALAYQMKQILAGRDPEPMDTANFWQKAMLQGGGFGILGDFVTGSDEDRYGQNIFKTLAGPQIGFLADTLNMTVNRAFQYATDADAREDAFTKSAKDLIKMGRYIPGQSAWFNKLLFERLLIDQAKLWADPKAQQKMRTLERKYRKENNQQYWWRPGRTSPSRKPDVSLEQLRPFGIGQ